MWTLAILACSAALTLWMANGEGGRRGDGKGKGGPGGEGKRLPPPQILMIIQNPGVQHELRLTDEQKGAVTLAIKPVRAQFREESMGFADLQPRQRRQKVQELTTKITQAVHDALRLSLDPSQYQRLQEIELQTMGLRGLLNSRAVTALRFTEEQKAKIQAIVEETGRKAQKLTRGGPPTDAETKDQLASLRKDAFRQGSVVLTADQQKVWQSLIGEPFQIRFEPRPQRPVAEKPNPESDPFSFEDDDDL